MGERRALSAYRLAGHPVLVDRPDPLLEPFAAPEGASEDASDGGLEPLGRPVPGPPETARRLFAGPAWLAGRTREVACHRIPGEAAAGGGYHLTVAAGGRWWVSADGGRVERLAGSHGGIGEGIGEGPGEAVDEGEDGDEHGDGGDLLAVALGPALLLALALRGTFCLHASALAGPAGAVALVGPSGVGKSTLARALADPARDPERGPAPRRLSDDLLPFEVDAPVEPVASVASVVSVASVAARPRFPQPQLGPGGQPGADAPEALPLAAVVLLAPRRGEAASGGRSEAGEARLDPVAPREALAVLIRESVAARLFAPDLLERHFAALAALVASVPVHRLSYPWGLEHLAALGRTLAPLWTGGGPR